ncbi:unnamed protein product [Heterobilharzia americana]|nr:unnamed protein product [Heterobilharzia americana]
MLSRNVSIRDESDSLCLTKENLKRSKVVGQFDEKVILLTCDIEIKIDRHLVEVLQPTKNTRKYIFGIDQHAGHERILLERFENECIDYFHLFSNVNNSERAFSRDVSIKLTGKDVDDIYRHLKHKLTKSLKLSNYGFAAYFERCNKQNIIHVTKIPLMICRKDVTEKLIIEVITKCIRTLVADGGKSHGEKVHNIMQAIYPILQSRACHSAIRFGSKLNKNQMKLLISQLSECRLPFQCAHGRPTCALIKIIE